MRKKSSLRLCVDCRFIQQIRSAYCSAYFNNKIFFFFFFYRKLLSRVIQEREILREKGDPMFQTKASRANRAKRSRNVDANDDDDDGDDNDDDDDDGDDMRPYAKKNRKREDDHHRRSRDNEAPNQRQSTKSISDRYTASTSSSYEQELNDIRSVENTHAVGDSTTPDATSSTTLPRNLQLYRQSIQHVATAQVAAKTLALHRKLNEEHRKRQQEFEEYEYSQVERLGKWENDLMMQESKLEMDKINFDLARKALEKSVSQMVCPYSKYLKSPP